MSEAGGRAVERAEAMVALENETAIAEIRHRLRRQGTAECVDCGDDIPAKRRAAMPSARRCAWCQSSMEEASRRGQ